jgi:hypothetical protein
MSVGECLSSTRRVSAVVRLVARQLLCLLRVTGPNAVAPRKKKLSFLVVSFGRYFFNSLFV